METSNDITIRRARIDDHVAVCALLDSLHGLHHEHAPSMFRPPASESDSRARLAAFLAMEGHVILVADSAGEVAGIARGAIRKSPAPSIFVEPHWAVLEELVVAPAWRRRGIGRLLTAAVEQWAVACGAPSIELNVYDFNADARRFYESLGYLPLTRKLRKPLTPDR